MSQFSRSVAVIFSHEGGYVDHPDDPGGATNLGITHRTLAAWRDVPSVTRDDVRALTHDEARAIYLHNYWRPVQADNLPKGVDLSAFDMAVNAGPTRAVEILQRVVGVADDGHMGPITLAAVRAMAPGELIDAYADARMAYYRSLRHWPTFKAGWTRRVRDTQDTAHDMRLGFTVWAPGLTVADKSARPGVTERPSEVRRIINAILDWFSGWNERSAA